jgi:hypothetical protein
MPAWSPGVRRRSSLEREEGASVVRRAIAAIGLIPRDIVPVVAWQWTREGWTPAVGTAYRPPSPMTTRWLDTRDVRGSTKTPPILFDAESLAWLTLDEIRASLKPFGATGEPGRRRKNVTLVHWTVDDGVADDGWLNEREDQEWMSRLTRRNWRQRAAQAPLDHPAIQSARLDRLAAELRVALRGRTTGVPLADPRVRVRIPKRRLGKFNPDRDLKTSEARAKWDADQARYRAIAFLDGRNSNGTGNSQGERRALPHDKGKGDDGGWARGVGIKKGPRILAVKRARERAEARAYPDRRPAAIRALDVLQPAVQKVLAIGRGQSGNWHTLGHGDVLVHRLVIELAWRSHEALGVLGEAQEHGATEFDTATMLAIAKALTRLMRRETRAEDVTRAVTGVLRGQPGDGRRALEAAVAWREGVSVQTIRKRLAGKIFAS